MQICRALLESKDWDLEATVMEHMGIPRENVRERAPPQQQNPNHLPEVPNARSALQARRPNRVHRNQGRNLAELKFYDHEPLRTCSIALNSLYLIILYIHQTIAPLK